MRRRDPGWSAPACPNPSYRQELWIKRRPSSARLPVQCAPGRRSDAPSHQRDEFSRPAVAPRRLEQLEGHRQARHLRARALGHALAQPDRRERRLDPVRGPQVLPVSRRVIEEGHKSRAGSVVSAATAFGRAPSRAVHASHFATSDKHRESHLTRSLGGQIIGRIEVDRTGWEDQA
jgi:hypothetical protein